jgi:hypothetical protein
MVLLLLPTVVVEYRVGDLVNLMVQLILKEAKSVRFEAQILRVVRAL